MAREPYTPVPSHKREAINRMGARLSATLRRCDPPLPDSLRLCAVRVVREGILRGMEGFATIYPGMTRMAAWGGCSERQARRNVRTMEAWGLMQPVEAVEGGRKSTRFVVWPEAIIRLAIDTGANPHPDLIAEIRDMRADMGADMRADTEGGHKAGHMSAGSYDTTVVALPLATRAVRGAK